MTHSQKISERDRPNCARKWSVAITFSVVTAALLAEPANALQPFGSSANKPKHAASSPPQVATNYRTSIDDSQDIHEATSFEHGPHEFPVPQDFEQPIECEQGATLSRFMTQMSHIHPDLEDVQSVIAALQVPCKEIASLVRKSTITGQTGLEGGGGSINVQGEEQKVLDIVANDVMKDALKWSGVVGTLASEEEDAPVSVEPVSSHSQNIGPYTVVFDPLDGSSNIDAGIAVGTIFGVFRRDEDNESSCDSEEERCLQDSLLPGNELVAAGYCLYSTATTLVFTTGHGVNGFTLDEQVGEFVLTHPNMVIPERGNTYSFNEANRWEWDEALQEYVTDIQQGQGETGERYSSRYVGSMVADVHRTLLYGGIFGYPADKKNPDGKLRLLYEAAPMSFVVEQAGGLSWTEEKRILNIEPDEVHQRVPCILGSPDDVRECLSYFESGSDDSSKTEEDSNRRPPAGTAFFRP